MMINKYKKKIILHGSARSGNNQITFRNNKSHFYQRKKIRMKLMTSY